MKFLAALQTLFSTIFVLPAAALAAPWEFWTDPRRLALLGDDTASLMASSYCLDGCRYDRTSDDPGRGTRRFIRLEQTPDGEQGVIFDQPGAGAVTRIWMTSGDGVSQPLDPNVRIRVYLDGAAAPAIDRPLPEFFNGVAPHTAPLALDRDTASGGNVSYVPIVFRNGVKIALLNGAPMRLWYQVNYATTPDAIAIAPRTDEHYGDLRAYLDGAGNDSLLAAAPVPGDEIVLQEGAAPTTVVAQHGGGWLKRASLSLAPEYWDDVELSLSIDGETVAAMPIGNFFFAQATDQAPQRGAYFGVDRVGAFYTRLPLPFRDAFTLALRIRDGHTPGPVRVRYASEFDPTMPPANAGRFHVRHVATCANAMSRDTVLLDHRGSGRIVGIAAAMTTHGGLAGGYYLEGDERLYIDGSTQPLWYGTGVEDMFNGGFYFDRGAYAHPLAAAPLRQPGWADDATRMVRWFLADAPAWRNAIRFTLENGAWGTEPLCLSANVYYFYSHTSAQIKLATLSIGNHASERAADYRPAADAQCAAASGLFGDEPPTTATFGVCAGTQPSRYTFVVREAGTAFRLRRTVDASLASTGGQATQVWINGAHVGAFAPMQANPTRRWTQQDVDVRLPSAASRLDVEIRPVAGAVGEAAYELWGTPPDVLFDDSFEAAARARD